MYKLYGAQQSGSVATEAVLAEVGEDLEKIEIDTSKGDQFSETYTRINPRQQVPALELSDGEIITEGIAILMHIADTHPEAGLAPPCGTVERAQLNRWLSFFATNVYEGESRRIRASRYSTDPNGGQYVAEAARDYIARQYEVFEGFLSDGPYYKGDQFTILDIYLWLLVQWWGDFEWLRKTCPRIYRLSQAVRKREKIEPIHLAHFG